MSEKTKTILMAIVTAIALAVFCVTLVQAYFYAPSDEIPLPKQAQVINATSTTILPSRLLIPSLGIDANVQYVGVTASGNMATPRGFADVSWYKLGTIPGNQGSAVMAGHVDNGLGLAGVFKHLDQLKAGDDIYVVDKAGSKLHFVVTRTELYDYAHVPTDIIFNRNNAAHLNLITCQGAWVSRDKTYDHRLVVFTTYRGV